MATTTTPTAPVASPGFDEPTEQDALAALCEVAGDEEGRRHWADARAAAGVPEGTLGLDELWGVAQALARQGGMVGVTARSLGIRIRSYVLLSQKQGRL